MKPLLQLKIYPKLFTKLVLSFIFFAIIGTLSHEFGHYLAARYLEYEARIDYRSTWITGGAGFDEMVEIATKYDKEIRSGKPFPEKLKYEILVANYEKHDVFIVAAGPLQTMLTGTFGFILLLIYTRKQKPELILNFTSWLLVFLSLFWLRQIACMVTEIFFYLLNGEFHDSGDEVKLSLYYALPAETIYMVTSLIGALIVGYVIFKIIPANYRFTFLLSGIVGGSAGALLWFGWLGPLVLP